VARPAKSLAEHLRDGSFRARRHHALLSGQLVESRKLRKLQTGYQAASTERERRAWALDFEQAATRIEKAQALEESPETDELTVADFFARYFRHSKGPLAGCPFVLEPWQRAFVDEFYRRDEDGRRIYRLGLLGVPRGNGKSPLAAGLALHELVTRTDSPDVFAAAASRDQARIVFNFARSFVESGELLELVRVGRNELVCPERLGSMRVLSADGALQYGHSVSAAIVDELHAFTSGKQEELYLALETALHKRVDSFMLGITTSGYDRETLLGRLFEGALAGLELERPHECLTIGRDEESGTLLWWFAAPDTADLDDEQLWRAANPASWVDLRDLRRQRHRPGGSEAAFRRLHLNQWTAGEEVWITAERWAACLDVDEEIPEDADVFVGVDASWTNDATAVAVAHKLEDGRVVLRCHVWSALAETEAHTRVYGGRIDFGAVEDFIGSLAQRYRVREVVFDPDFFARSAELLSEQGLMVAPIDQRSRAMREAYSQFYEAVGACQVAHDGDAVLTAHVTAAAATLDEYGSWKVRKKRQTRKIDGLVACVIAFSRAAREPARREVLIAFT
jgi:phage terminase large subunit-like protein